MALLASMTKDMGLFMEVAGTLVIAIVLTVFAIVEMRKAKPAATVLFGMAILMGVFSGVLWGTMNDRGSRWRWILATLPALILMAHAAFLYYVRSRVIPKATGGNVERGRAMLRASAQTSEEDAAAAIQSALQNGERYFSIEALMLRYFVPALFVFGLTLGISNQLCKWAVLYGLDQYACATQPGSAGCKLLLAATGAGGYVKAEEVVFLPASSVIGAACGLIGAYVYVLLYLGRRAFRLDITPGAATWCAVTIAVGPALAGFLGPYVLGSNPWKEASELQRASVLFFAGFSPRLIVSLLNELVTRLFGDRPGKTTPNRGVPLNQISGISRDLEERLSEEGIDDASQLAMADPYRLLRNTSYDKRQILRWIDTAILAVSLPESFPALERRGVGGATSLVWYTQHPDRAVSLKQLAKDAKIDESVLADLAARLATDGQVMLVRLLYELDDRNASSAGAA